jgi:hypothetical protein
MDPTFGSKQTNVHLAIKAHSSKAYISRGLGCSTIWFDETTTCTSIYHSTARGYGCQFAYLVLGRFVL